MFDIDVFPHTPPSEWIAMTNARVFDNNNEIHNNEIQIMKFTIMEGHNKAVPLVSSVLSEGRHMNHIINKPVMGNLPVGWQTPMTIVVPTQVGGGAALKGHRA